MPVGTGSSRDGGGGGGGPRGIARDGDDQRFFQNPDGTPMATVVVGRPDDIPSCPIIQDSIDYWTSQYPRVDADDVAKAVRRIYGFKLRSAVAHMLTANQRGSITAEQLKQAMTWGISFG
jgi:hypothetical protein